MRPYLIRNRRKIRLFLLVVLLLITFSVGFIHFKKEHLKEDFKTFITSHIEKKFGYKFEVEDVKGTWFGSLYLLNVELKAPLDDDVWETIFRAKSVRLRYDLSDLFHKQFLGWFDVVLVEPTFYYQSVQRKPSVETPSSTNIPLISGLTHRVQENSRIEIHDGSIVWNKKAGIVSGVDGVFENQRFHLNLSLNHYKLGPLDLSSTLICRGQVDHDLNAPRFYGDISTRGTVINWKPLPRESHIKFELTMDKLVIKDADILSGIKLQGTINYAEKQDANIALNFNQYPLGEVYDLISVSDSKPTGSTMDGEILITGSILQPRIDGKIVFVNPEEKAKYENIQFNFEGIYPEVNLSESRMILPDGSSMRFSNQDIHLRELFNSQTLQRLVTDREQTSIFWGDWKLIRKEDVDSVSLKHALSDDLSISYEHSEFDETQLHLSENENEVEVSYLLGEEDSFKLRVRDNESFFGLERKTSF